MTGVQTCALPILAPARVRLAGLATTLTSAAPATGLLSNRDGRVIASGTEYLDRLVDQVTNPVRWDLCLQAMADHGATGVLELAPAGTLTGIVKRNLPGVARFNLNTPDQLDDARDFCTAHAGTRRGKLLCPWVVECRCDFDFASDVTFDLRKGEVLGIAGLVGSRRTERPPM